MHLFIYLLSAYITKHYYSFCLISIAQNINCFKLITSRKK